TPVGSGRPRSCRAERSPRSARSRATKALGACSRQAGASRASIFRRLPSTSIPRRISGGCLCGPLGVSDRCTGRAVDPAARAVRVVFLLPDRHAVLDLVDHVAARVERRAAVRGAHADPARTVADLEPADAMLGEDLEHVETLLRLGDDLLALGDGDRLVRLVLEQGDLVTVLVIAHPAFERHARAGARVTKALFERARIDRGRANREAHRQPPATGGKNSPSSPCVSSASQSQSSSLIATLQRTRASAKPWRSASSLKSSAAVRAEVVIRSDSAPTCSRKAAK